jgi:hypothetical protein
MFNFFKKLFKKKDNLLTIEYVKENGSIEPFIDTEVYIEKWCPDDTLYLRYNNFIDELGQIKSNQYKLKKYIEQKEYHENKIKELKKTKKDIFDEVNRLDYEIELENIKIRIKKCKDSLKTLQYKNTSILKEWKDYIQNAKEFIERNSLEQFITINDILSSNNIFIALKKQFDGALVSSNNEKYIETFSKLSLYFDIRKTRGNMTLNYYKNEEIMNKRKELIKKLNKENIFSLDYTEQQRNTITKQLENSLLFSKEVENDNCTNLTMDRIVDNPDIY